MDKKLQSVNLNSPKIKWEGAVSVERRGKYHMPWRIPYKFYDYFPPDGLGGNAVCPAGVRLTFISNTDEILLDILPLELEDKLDILCDGQFEQTVVIEKGKNEISISGLPAKEKRIEIYLPLNQGFRLTKLFIKKGASLKTFKDTRPKWITYGSSITQCATAYSPSQTWPALVARSRNLHLTCIGFGGNCHAEPMVARMIRDLPADIISLCFGINIYGANSLSPRTFKSAIIGFIQIIREKHHSIPIVVCSPIISPPRETEANAVGFTLVEMRKQLLEVTQILEKYGDKNIYYVDGLKILGEEFVKYLPDQVHPDGEGYKILAKNFEREVFKKL